MKSLLRIIAVAVVASQMLAGCATTTPSAQSDENDLAGKFTVVDQSRRNGLHADTVEVKFFRNDPDVSGGVSAGYLKLVGPSVPDGWAYPACGFPGDRAKGSLSGNADPADVEIIRCSNPRNIRSMPVAYLVKTKDGRAFRYSTGPLDLFDKSLDVTTGRLLIIWWGPENMSAYVLKSV